MVQKKTKGKGLFPKIATKTELSDYKKVKGGIIVKPKLEFSPDQHEQIDEWIENGDELMVTIEQVQSRMNDEKPGAGEIPFEEDT